MTSLGGETVFTLNRKRLKQLAAHAPAAPGDVRKMLRFEPHTGALEARSFGRLTAPARAPLGRRSRAWSRPG